RVEETLTEQAPIRQEVEKLTRVWELLDLLPESKASAKFTERTLSAIQTQQAEAEGEAADTRPIETQRARHWEPRLRVMAMRFVGLLGLILLGTSGFNGAFRRDTDGMDQLLNHLPVIERLDEYREAGSLEYLQKLNDSGLLNDEPDSNK
ncbi:MAG: hypothetical protein ACYTGL_27625, partial [Planctomycetota bacterium]